MKIKHYYNQFKNIGIHNNLSKLEQKRIRLLNIFCSNWFVIELVLMTEDAINKPDPTLQLLIHSGTVIGLFITVFLQKSKKYQLARILFFSLILYSNFMFCNFAERGGYIEYFYIVVPVFLLLFTNNKYLIYSIFIISYLLFVIPINYFDIYPEGTFGSPVLILIQFVIFFFLVQYFKNANIRSEKILENQRKQLEELNEFQSQFFINVSHEIRTPLTLIKGEIDKLNLFKNTSYAYESEKISEGLDKQVSKIKTIVDDVLDLAKMKDANFKINTEKVLLNELIHKLYLSFEPLCNQKEICFKITNANTADYWIKADSLFLERAINNIIVNAIKYTPKKGNITLNFSKKNDQVSLAITDTGIGISKKDIDLICNRFYQANNDINKAGGSGIGLAFSKEIIELHKGSLTIESDLDKGSTFTLTFPLTKASEHNSKEVNIQPTETTIEITNHTKITNTKAYTILIVDDNYDMRTYLKELLKSYNCIEAENGQEALTILSKNSIDFVLTDYMMPVMNGLTLIEQIKKKEINVPILMLTARTDSNSKLNVLRLGIDDYLNKPFEKEELLIRIENALYNHKNRNRFITDEAVKKTELEVNNQWIEKVKEYIYKECSNTSMTQEDVALHFNLSKSSLHRKLKSETGLTPNAFITEVKLQKARFLLEQNPAILLKSLALEVGYLHTSYFSKLYEQRFGVKPVKLAS
ncbi:hypothetical protein WH52_02535 [Tenacibaculum holothuriorum]|uniref:histidine kinase n=1 Tax=Tenacibaculum holothuriorum TaxID=1635173 RepID=A0A1Y2PIH1_9FLAO|nr:response regulator [Tenacibaculum holothuriorum]OSY89529.1 hypothetical protein WH52_02535 [Tenacibaculum holothuriorum]